MSYSAKAAGAAPGPRRTVLDWLLGLSAVATLWAVAYPLVRYAG